eukprot:8643958-Prorocentrum_lima.AAC.1
MRAEVERVQRVLWPRLKEPKLYAAVLDWSMGFFKTSFGKLSLFWKGPHARGRRSGCVFLQAQRVEH